MSYILDALRKAERDRNLGRTPSLGDVTAHAAGTAPAPPRRRTWVLAAIVVLLAALTFILWPQPRARAPAVTPAAAPPPLATVAPPAAVQAPPAVAAPAEAVPNVLDETVAAESMDDLLDASGELPLDAARPDEDPGTVPEPEPEPDTAIDPASPAPIARGEPEPLAPAAVAAPEPAADEPALEPSTDAVPLREMPAEFRASFPPVRVDVHVWQEDPARRWALINGQKVIEGSTLPEGPRIVQITPEGIVFDYRGRSVLVPNRN